MDPNFPLYQQLSGVCYLFASFCFILNTRYNLPIIIIIVNNNGIYSGFDEETFQSIREAGEVTKV
jgi:hypothetical protein